MAQKVNFFALLIDQETDDASKLIDTLKVEEPLKPSAATDANALEKKKEQQKPKQKFPMDPRTMRAKRIILPRHVQRSFLVLRKEKKDEPKLQEEPKEAEIKAAAATNSYRQQPRSDIGEKDKNIQGKNHPGNNYLGNGNYNGGYRGGRGGRGQGYQQRRRFYENNGIEKESQAVSYGNNNQQQEDNYYGKDQNQQYYGGYRPGQGPRQYYRRDGSKYYNTGMSNNGDKKSDEGGSSSNGDNKNVNFAVMAPEDAASNGGTGDSKERNIGDKKGDKKSNMMKNKSCKGVENKTVNKAGEKERVDYKKLMTLKEYEEFLAERKKPLEALKKDHEGRKVMADEELGSMTIIGKKKNEEKKSAEEKKKDYSHSVGEEKVHKSMSITEFLRPDGNRPYWRGNEQRNYGRQEEEHRPFFGGGGGDGGMAYNGGRGGRGRGDDYDPHIEDLSQFPMLGGHGST
ncbi:hypothetical protein REPUB_Repub20aG0063000 [Reevesia pubescens]